ncbi:MAG: twin-arginine translocase subunit TatC [Verrucomicrobiae bacterium]|nr:twin-arginine translocase subunit TatC [Verrucomicrobiae bacterium]
MPFWPRKKKPAKPSPTPPPPEEDGEGEVKPFWEHLEDLRWTLIKSIIAVFVGFNICMAFANRILAFLTAPLHQVVPNPENFLQTFDVMGGFMIWMKLSFYGGLVLAAPFVFYFFAQFVWPALKRKEKEIVVPVFFYGAALFIAGAATTYYCLLVPALKAFVHYNKWLGIQTNWRVESYVQFVTQFMLAMGITLEMPLVVLVLVRLGIISAAAVQRGWKVMVLIAAVIAAIVAPADPGSMLLMMIPMVILIGITIWLAWIIEGRRKKKLAAVGEVDTSALIE